MKNDSDRNLNDLDVLYEVTTILAENQRPDTTLRQVFEVLDRRAGLVQGTVMLAERFRDAGLTESESVSHGTGVESIREVVGDLARSVMKEGQPRDFPMEIEGKLREIERYGEHTRLHLIAFPLIWEGDSLGAVSVVRALEEGETPEDLFDFLGILAGLLTQMVLIHHSSGGDVGQSTTGPATEDEHEFRPPRIRGNSKSIRAVFDAIGQVAASDTTVLLFGESGVGKELVADALHYNSARKEQPFVKLNCAALPESLLESELFGHEKGSFTGAMNQKKGRFELANGGTLFLDEIGDISPATQVKLLRFLQEREYERVGGVETLTSDVRVITATNRNLEEMIDQGEFRLDLYYRLNVFPIHVPALRERKPDIIPIADHFIEKYSKKLKKDVVRISTPAIDLLVSYHWPGNVRELENCIERAVLLSNDGVIHSHHLPPSLQTAEASTRHQESLRATLDSVERELIADALRGAKGNMAKASRALGLTERVMGLRTRKYKLDPRKFRG